VQFLVNSGSQLLILELLKLLPSIKKSFR